MTIKEYFEELKTKDIICYGSGKHFRNITLPFLEKSGLIDNLKGFVDGKVAKDIEFAGRSFRIIGKENLAAMDPGCTVILIAVTGYEEILSQLRSDARLSAFEAVPSIFIEALYEDMQLLSAKKPPVNYRKHDKPVIPGSFTVSGFLGTLCPLCTRNALIPGKSMLMISR